MMILCFELKICFEVNGGVGRLRECDRAFHLLLALRVCKEGKACMMGLVMISL